MQRFTSQRQELPGERESWRRYCEHTVGAAGFQVGSRWR